MRDAYGIAVSADEGVLGALEAELAAQGYQSLAFETCCDAIDWLEQDTPELALVDVAGDPDVRGLLGVLRARHVQVVSTNSCPPPRGEHRPTAIPVG